MNRRGPHRDLDDAARENLVNDIRSKITKLEDEIERKGKNRGSTDHRALGEHMGRFWSGTGKEAKTRDAVNSMAIPKKTDTEPQKYAYKSTEMAEALRSHHARVQLLDLDIDEDLREEVTQKVLGNITAQDDETTETLGERLTNLEIRTAIRKSPNHKAPGMDGIPSEYYKKLLERHEAASENEKKNRADIAHLLTRVYNDIEIHGVSKGAESFSEGWLCPIYKNRGDKRDPAAYRPITVLNSRYKIFTSALMYKLSEIAPKMIHEDQAGFVPGRSIMDQVDQLQLMMELCETRKINGVIVALDQEKAYDRIRHDYLWKVLEANNIPESFISTIRSLYTGATTRMMVNGELSSPLTITRGVRQGDPISCLLFNLAIEPLAEMIRREGKLKGLEVPSANEQATRVIVSLFADDTTVFLSKEDKYRDLLAVLDEWCIASGAKFNIDKTWIYPVGTEEYRREVADLSKIDANDAEVFPIKTHILRDGESHKHLGAYIGYDFDLMSIWSDVRCHKRYQSNT